MPSFTGRTALVTGGARGVGRVISTRLAESGAHVVVNCFHSWEAGRDLRDELRAAGHRVDLLRGSVARRDHVERMVAELGDLTDRLDLLVNNAASGAFGSVVDSPDSPAVPDDAITKALDTNLRGAWWVSAAVRPLMVAAGGGAIVNVSSLGAGLVPGNYAAVGTSKAAVEALTRYLAVELAADGIRANTASAGLLDGDVARMFPDAEGMVEAVRRATPLGRLGNEADLADVVLFLLSDQSRWITGQTVVADGGLSLGGAMLTPAALWDARQERRAAREAVSATPAQPDPVAQPQPQPEPVAQLAAALAVPAPRVQEAVSVEVDEDPDAVVIVGAGIVVPGATSVGEYWDVLAEGPEMFVESYPQRWRAESFMAGERGEEDKSYQSRSAYVTAAIADPAPRGGDAAAVAGTDVRVEYTSRWLRRSVAEAMEKVRMPDDARVGCVFGYTADGNHHLEEVVVVEGILTDLDRVLRAQGRPDAERERVLAQARGALEARYPRTGVDRSLLWPRAVGRAAVSGLVPDSSELIMVDTACSSSLYALDIGLKALQEHTQDVVVCGGSFAVGPRNSVLFAKLNGLSSSGHVRPLDAGSDGVLFSDGAAVVVMKRLADARRDGDRILGHVLAVGSSSDGKGKAIYAPSVAGQRKAVQRAWAKAPEPVADLSWVVAHATGTPAGDLCELTALGSEIPAGAPVTITSNKAVIGHTGWAAGVASVIQVLQGFERSAILPQHRFEQLPAKLPEGLAHIDVPTQEREWTGKGRPRVAAVSGFGFGGTNSHVLLTDTAPRRGQVLAPGAPAPGDDEPVVVAWGAQLPGLDDRDAVGAWLDGGPAPAASFGERFTQAPRTLRIPPPTQRVLDRCQLMVVNCAQQIKDQLGAVWSDHAQLTGVFLGHMGPTRSAISYAKRCYLDDVASATGPDGAPVLAGDLLQALREEVRSQVPPSTEDSFPGMMPNVIAARISNYFDLNGPNMVIDTGLSSTLSAFEVARRYLRHGDVELALVGGLNGNSTPEVHQLVETLLGAPADVHEAAVLFAVTTAGRAREWGLPVLARLSAAEELADGVGQRPAPRGVTHLAADAALDVLRAIHDAQVHPEAAVSVAAGGDGGMTRLYVTGPAATPPRGLTIVVDDQTLPALPSAASSAQPSAQPSAQSAPAAAEPVERQLQRHVTGWVPAAPRSRQAAPLPLLTGDVVVVTATPATLGGLGGSPGDPLVLSTVPCAAGPRRVHVGELDAATVAALIAERAPQSRHLRIVTDLDALLPARTAVESDWSAVADLHDLTFLVAQAMVARLEEADASVLGLFLRGDDGADVHPFAGLFTGFLKSVALELPCHVASVFTTSGSLTDGLRELAVEADAVQTLPVAAHRNGVRHVVSLTARDARPAASAPLDADSVVLAVGGGRGITAELLKQVVAPMRPTMWLIGSTPVAELEAEVREIGGPHRLMERPEYLRRSRETDPKRAIKDVNVRYERLVSAADVLATIAELEALCGAGRVHYRQADVRDPAAVRAVVDEVHQRHARVDLVLHAAGVNRSAALATKTLESFRLVRAVKVGGYCSLRAAFAGRPAPAWCSFGSFIGLTGQIGEADYASANDFLTTAAAQRRRKGIDEFTIGWTLWDEIGMGAHPVTRAFLAKSGVFTRMSTAEGIAHFRDEILGADHEAGAFHLGDAERAAIAAKLPGFLPQAGTTPATTPTAPAGPVSAPLPEPFYIDRIVEATPGRLVAERLFTHERDGYLDDHAVAGTGTLPGLFVPEMAAEAASALVPDLVVTGFRDVAFERFLKLVPSLTATPRRIVATLRSRSRTAAVVDIEVRGDVTAAGRVVQPDVRHFAATVVMADAFPAAPHWPGLGAGPLVTVPDPYHVSGAQVELRGPFVTTSGLAMHPLGKVAEYRSPVTGDHPVFGRFRVPSLLLDGLARVAVADLVAGRYVPVAAPRSIRRIDLYEDGGDAVLGARHGRLDLTVTPADLSLEDMTSPNRFVAARKDGTIVLQMHDVRGIVLNFIDATTLAGVERRDVDAALLAGASALRAPAVAL